jgi:hypothetical protein
LTQPLCAERLRLWCGILVCGAKKARAYSLGFDSGSHPNGKYGVSFFSNYSGGFCEWWVIMLGGLVNPESKPRKLEYPSVLWVFS